MIGSPGPSVVLAVIPRRPRTISLWQPVILTAWGSLSGFPDFDGQAFAEHTECGFELIEPGGVEQVEQAVHLGESFTAEDPSSLS